MPDTHAPTDQRRAWASRMRRIGADHGFFERIGRRHMALFVQEGETLVLSFARADRLWEKGDAGLPLGFDAVLAHEFSLLSLMSAGRSWFRDAAVEALLAGLAKKGFFRSYKQVLILANSPVSGHAAARAARHVPGAKMLLSRPIAALGPRDAPFETRLRKDRYANPDWPPPIGADAVAKAAHCAILFDGANKDVAAQAALFSGANTTRIDLPHSGSALDRAVAQGAALVPLTRHLAKGTLTPATARAVLRKILRRDPGYLARLAHAADEAGHPARAQIVRRQMADLK